jgi:hypothetical protein
MPTLLQKIPENPSQEAHDPFFFCTAVHRSAQACQVMYDMIDRLTHPQHARSALLRCVVLA